MSKIAEDLKYAESHEWIDPGTDPATVGISDHAQAELTDVVHVELPEVGAEVEQGDPVAVVDSVKAASDIFSPASGEVVEVNTALEDQPELINTDPYGDGWIFKIKISDDSELESLLNASAYGDSIA